MKKAQLKTYKPLLEAYAKQRGVEMNSDLIREIRKSLLLVMKAPVSSGWNTDSTLAFSVYAAEISTSINLAIIKGVEETSGVVLLELPITDMKNDAISCVVSWLETRGMTQEDARSLIKQLHAQYKASQLRLH